MNLRKLKLEDAPLMLEWMHDITVTEDLQTDFSAKTLADCESFITLSLHDRNNLHLAITDDYDIYMGTVSLKNMIASAAEFAIVIRKCAMGKGFSRYAMTEMLRIGTEEMGLRQIYWYVSPNNKRAIRFYEKNGYQRTTWDDVKILSRGVFRYANYFKYLVFVGEFRYQKQNIGSFFLRLFMPKVAHK